MTAYDEDDHTTVEIVPNLGMKILHVLTASDVIGGTDDITVDLNLHGCTNVHAVWQFDETTAGEAVVQATPTSTAVSAGVLTVDLGGSETGVHSIIILAY